MRKHLACARRLSDPVAAFRDVRDVRAVDRDYLGAAPRIFPDRLPGRNHHKTAGQGMFFSRLAT